MAKNIEGSIFLNFQMWNIAKFLFYWGFEDDDHFGYITKLTNKHCKLYMPVQYLIFQFRDGAQVVMIHKNI
jgi:hypothetical protein